MILSHNWKMQELAPTGNKHQPNKSVGMHFPDSGLIPHFRVLCDKITGKRSNLLQFSAEPVTFWASLVAQSLREDSQGISAGLAGGPDRLVGDHCG